MDFFHTLHRNCFYNTLLREREKIRKDEEEDVSR